MVPKPIKYKRIPIDEAIPAAYNPRVDLQESDAEYIILDKSMEEFGCVQPIVWNETTGHIVSGHQRYKILKRQGQKHIDVIVVKLPLKKEKQLNLTMNKSSGRWDEDKLTKLFAEFQECQLDLSITGFDVGEIQDLFDRCLPGEDRQEDVDPDSVLNPDAPALIEAGEIIELGSHRLMCGSSTDEDAVKRLMGEHRAALVATDPPYLVSYDGANRPTKKRGAKVKANEWDSPDAQPELFKKYCKVAVDHAAKTDAAYYAFHASRTQGALEEAWVAAGLFVHQQIIWVKERAVPGRSHYSWAHEPLFFGWQKPHCPPTVSSEKLSTVWELPIPAGKERPNHPTPKPVEAFAIPMRQHTVAGDVCYEPFAGSGTQIIAAEKLKRRCFAMELSPHYCDLIVRRYIAFVGRQNVNSALAERFANKEVAHV